MYLEKCIMEGNDMFYKNARIYAGDFQFHTGAFEVKDGLFGEILPENVSSDAIDLNGATVIPGLVEVHSHGNCGADFSDGDYKGLKTMAKFYAQCGITSFAPTSMTLPYDVLSNAFATSKQLVAEAPEGHARLIGIHMEGPYLSFAKRGAQNPEYLIGPDFDGFKKLYDECDGLIRIVDIAPELPGAAQFVKKASKLCTVSIAHTDADYNNAKAAIDAGVTHITHLYNAMPVIHHRNPGVIPAGVENPNVQAEIICDGYHVHPACVRMAFSMFKNRTIIVSDSGRCAGQPEGYRFNLGGQMAELRGGVAKLIGTETIACSASNMWDCLRNAISWNIPEEEAVRAASYNPAKALGVHNKIGSIETGKYADFIITNADYSEKRVFIGGKEL